MEEVVRMSELRLRVEGFAARDPEVKQLPSGVQVATVLVAVNERRLNAAREWEDGDTTWVEVEAYGAEIVQVVGVVKKGTLIVAEGRARLRAYLHESGAARAAIKVSLGTLFVVRSAEAVADRRQQQQVAAHAASSSSVPF